MNKLDLTNELDIVRHVMTEANNDKHRLMVLRAADTIVKIVESERRQLDRESQRISREDMQSLAMALVRTLERVLAKHLDNTGLCCDILHDCGNEFATFLAAQPKLTSVE